MLSPIRVPSMDRYDEEDAIKMYTEGREDGAKAAQEMNARIEDVQKEKSTTIPVRSHVLKNHESTRTSVNREGAQIRSQEVLIPSILLM